MTRTRAAALQRIANVLKQELSLNAAVTRIAVGWQPGSESGLPLPTRLTLSLADGSIHVYDENGAALDENGQPLNDLAFLDALDIHGDLLELLEADFGPGQDGGTETYAMPASKPGRLDEALAGTDWALLAKQKETLLAMRHREGLSIDERDALNGVIHLLDAWTDGAHADGWGVREQVFTE